MNRRLSYSLPGGEFELEMFHEELPLEELCGFALRRNLKRRFLFVSRVLGRHVPVRPAAVRRVAGLLASRIRQAVRPGPVVFFGMAETATTLGQAVFREWLAQGGAEGLYIDTTRRLTGGPVAFSFSEDHSHATAHIVHAPGIEEDPDGIFHRATQIVIVDDEATTGNTAAHLVQAYCGFRGVDASQVDAHLAVLLRWCAPGADSAGLRSIQALASGVFAFTATSEMQEVPPPAVITADARLPAPRRGRHGTRTPLEWTGALPVVRGSRTLVLGTGEFGFLPLRLAEWLEERGEVAEIAATTRSPILAGGEIGHVRAFPSLIGEAHQEFLYNVPDNHGWDRILLCLEGHSISPDHPLHSVPRLELLPICT